MSLLSETNAIESLLSNYDKEYNIDSEVAPRTEHDLGHFYDALRSPTKSLRLTQKEVRSLLFSKEGQDIFYHASDIEDLDSDLDLPNSPSSDSLFETPKNLPKNLKIHKVDASHSLTKALALHLGDGYETIEENIMEYEYRSQSDSTFNFNKIKQSEIRRVLQVVSNIYNRKIILKRCSKSHLIEVITPLTSWMGNNTGPDVLLLQSSDGFASLQPKSKPKVRIADVVEDIDPPEDDIHQEIANTFLKGKISNERDMLYQSIIEQGPASLDGSLEDFTEPVFDMDASQSDNLSNEIKTKHSPMLPRKSGDIKGAVNRVLDSHIKSLSTFTSTGSFDDALNIALEYGKAFI